MRTDLTATLAGSQVRGVITGLAWDEIIGDAEWASFMDALHAGDPRVVRRVLECAVRDAGDLRPLDAAAEVKRLMAEAPLRDLQAFALRLMAHAIAKVDVALGNSPTTSDAAATGVESPSGT